MCLDVRIAKGDINKAVLLNYLGYHIKQVKSAGTIIPAK
jgi:hypothetical protein